MAFQPAPAVAECVMRGVQFGQQTVNTLYFQKSTGTPWTAAELIDLAGTVDTGRRANIELHQGNEWIDNGVVATDISVVGGLQVESNLFAGSVGAIGGGCAPGNVTFAIKFLTGHVGRSYRGRNFIPGIPDGYAGANVISSANAAQYVADYVALSNSALAEGFVHVIVSRIQGGVVPAVALVVPVTTIAYTDVNLDSMRSRLTGRGS